MTVKVFGLDTQPGVQRDGTVFDNNFYTDGRWIRFQRKRPRKILGYKQIVNNLAGLSRGIYVNPQAGFNYVFSGYSDGLQVLPINQNGIGAGISDFTLSNFTANANNMWQFDSLKDSQGTGNNLLFAHPGQNLLDINNQVNTPVLQGRIDGLTMSKLGQFTISATLNSTVNVTVASTTGIGSGQLVTGTGIPSSTYVDSVTSTTVFTITNAATVSSTSTLTIDNQLAVSGGVVCLHPYVFIYGNDGLIQNCAAGNTNDWRSADSNANNVASTKVVQALPVRGGSTAPSGLFWTLDSLIKVNYNPTTVTIGGTSSTFYWRYDIVTSQSSILSSQCVIEYDGIYYWCGVDRFLLYNGVVKEVPNNMNQNYFFDNLNYAQRQKVYATKVPRYGEIWWFYPRGDSVECNDAIIYNIRENCWYDAGTALGARRSAGYFSQVFHYPINAGNEFTSVGGVLTTTIANAGSAYTNGTFTNVALTGGTGSGALATIVVAGGVVTSVTITFRGVNYVVLDFLSAALAGGTGFSLQVATVMNYVSLWQHEIGTDAVAGNSALAIESYFETSDLGFVSGGPSQPSLMGDNIWIRLDRFEPDFIQSGELELYITGRPFAQANDLTSGPFPFQPETEKVDLKEQRRELRVRIRSNVSGGDYQLGKMLLDAETGDVRG
jgi:hypothetical protein